MSETGVIGVAFRKLRADGQARVGSTLGGLVVGLVAAWLHPVGLVAGAVLVALPQRSVVRGLAAGIGFGLIVVATNLIVVAVGDGVAGVRTALAMRQVTGVSVALGVAAGVVGGLVRGVI